MVYLNPVDSKPVTELIIDSVRFDGTNMEILGIAESYQFSATFDDKGDMYFGGRSSILLAERPDLHPGIPASATAEERRNLPVILTQCPALLAPAIGSHSSTDSS